MSEKVNIRQALRVFEVIRSQGKKDGETFVLNGMKAITSIDGYTVTLHNDYVCLDIFFHNKFSFTYTNQKEKDLFLEKIHRLDNR